MLDYLPTLEITNTGHSLRGHNTANMIFFCLSTFPYMISLSFCIRGWLSLRPQYNMHSQSLRGIERRCYCVLKRRNGTPTWYFCPIHCKLHYLLLCASIHALWLHAHTQFGCQLVICGLYVTPQSYLLLI